MKNGNKGSFPFRRGVNASHHTGQVRKGRPFADPATFAAEDAAWIASAGFDHIRMPLDGEQLLRDGNREIDHGRMDSLMASLQLAREAGLGVVLDMHSLPGGHTVAEPRQLTVFTDPEERKVAVKLWSELARACGDFAPEELVFELFNEPVVAHAEELNHFYAELAGAVWNVAPRRCCVCTANLWGHHREVEKLRLPEGGPALYGMHYYEPFVFTHQASPWTELGPHGIKDVPFPGPVPDSLRKFPEGHELRDLVGTEMTEAQIEGHFGRVARLMRERKSELLLSEFGVYKMAPGASALRWLEVVLSALEEEGLPWTIWDYKGGFAIRDAGSGQWTETGKTVARFLDHPE